MKLDAALIKKLNAPMWATWNAIGYDIQQACSESGEELDNEQAVEACIDANRLAFFGGDTGKECDELVRDLCVEHGYHTVLKFLCQHFKYA